MSKRKYLIYLMILWIPLSLWSQEELRCYNRTQREIIASHNIDRIQYYEELVIADSVIKYYEGSIAYSTQQYNQLDSLNNFITSNNESLNEMLIDQDIEIKKIKRRRGTLRIIAVTQTVIIILLCLL